MQENSEETTQENVKEVMPENSTVTTQNNAKEVTPENSTVTTQNNAKEATQEDPKKEMQENPGEETQKNPKKVVQEDSNPDPDFGGWNDELLAELDRKCRFSIAVTSRESFKNIIARFYQAYFNNKIDPEDNLTAVVLDAVGIAAFWGGLLWTDDPDPSTSSYDENASMHTDLNIARNSNSADGTTLFVDRIVMLFNEIPTSPTDISSKEFLLRSLTGFLAMTLLRAAVKTEVQLVNTFNKDRYLKNLCMLTEWPEGSGFVPPAKEFIKTCCERLKKGTQGVKIGFTKLAALLTKNMSSDELHNPVRYMSAAVLCHTAGHGLGLILMVDNIVKHYGIRHQRLMELSKFKECLAGWINVFNLLFQFRRVGELEYGWSWARIIDGKYIRGLTPTEHPWFGVLLISIISCYQGPGVWNARWYRKLTEIHDDAKQLGVAIHRRLSIRGPLTGMSAEMAKLAKIVEKRNPIQEEIPDIQALYDALQAAKR